MSVKVMIPTPLRPHAGGKAAAEFQAKTVAEALGHLTAQYAGLKRHLFTEEGALRSFVNVYVNGEDIRYLAQENTPTKDGDTINIIPSIAGGSVTRTTVGISPRQVPAQLRSEGAASWQHQFTLQKSSKQRRN